MSSKAIENGCMDYTLSNQEMVICDGCGSVIGIQGDCNPNIKMKNPDVDLSELSNELIDSIKNNLNELQNDNESHIVFNEQQILQSIDDVDGDLEMGDIANDKIPMLCDEYDEYCDSCAIDHGVDINSPRKGLIKPVLNSKSNKSKTESNDTSKLTSASNVYNSLAFNLLFYISAFIISIPLSDLSSNGIITTMSVLFSMIGISYICTKYVGE